MSELDPKKLLSTLTPHPGVYQMLSDGGDVLYVGKAKSLRDRVASYFREAGLSIKNASLMKKVADIQVTVTGSETEALLLEQNLIKSLKPPYNILLRDDKSYPFIFLTDKAQFPAIGLHRGAKKKGVTYFGPFPSGLAVRYTLNLLQKSFLLRQCDDSYFRNRSRPCLQYQIRRCTGPCVGKISPEEYAEDVRHTRMFLEGKSSQLIRELQREMDKASESLAFERAAQVRDQLIHLRHIQEQQHVAGEGGDLDVIAGVVKPIGFCVHLLFIRKGKILGSKSYYPKANMVTSLEELLTSFVPQFYLTEGSVHQIPREIIVNHPLEQSDMVEDALCTVAKRKVQLRTRVKGQRARWLEIAENNADQNLLGHHAGKLDYQGRLLALQDALALEQVPQRMECFDISHTSGEETVASCVVFDSNGPLNSDYRRFNIKDITAGDDYAAMRQALTRRYARIQKGEGKLPDILFIDGGKGQLRIAEEVLLNLQVENVLLIGVAKGTSRKPGLESLFVAGRAGEILLPQDSAALHLIQHIRDEAHRFAISSHRQSRGKKRSVSVLERIPGVGAKRRRELLRYFGGFQEVARASIEDIARVPGISRVMAKQIYGYLHDE